MADAILNMPNGNPQEAQRLIEKAVPLVDNNPPLQVITYEVLGRVQWRLGRPDDALKSLNAALGFSEEDGSALRRVMALITLIDMYLALSSPQRVKPLLIEAEKLCAGPGKLGNELSRLEALKQRHEIFAW